MRTISLLRINLHRKLSNISPLKRIRKMRFFGSGSQCREESHFLLYFY